MKNIYAGSLPYNCNAKHIIHIGCKAVKEEPKPKLKHTIKFIVTPDSTERPAVHFADIDVDSETEFVIFDLKKNLEDSNFVGYLRSKDFEHQYYFNRGPIKEVDY